MTEHDDVRRPSAPADAETGYPGQGLGRPQDGPGSIPSLILFKNGREISRQAGAFPLQSLLEWLRSQGV